MLADDPLKLDFFITNSGDMNIQDIFESKPIHYAAVNSNPAFLIKLVELGCGVLDVDGSNETPLFWAVRNNSLECVKAIIDNKVFTKLSFKHKNDTNQTIMHLAAEENRPEILKYILNHILDKYDKTELRKLCNLKSVDSMNPMHIATQFGHLEVLKVFNEFGINPNYKDK